MPKKLKPDFKSQFENLTRRLRKLFRELLNYDAALRVHLEQTRKQTGKSGSQDWS